MGDTSQGQHTPTRAHYLQGSSSSSSSSNTMFLLASLPFCTRAVLTQLSVHMPNVPFSIPWKHATMLAVQLPAGAAHLSPCPLVLAWLSWLCSCTCAGAGAHTRQLSGSLTGAHPGTTLQPHTRCCNKHPHQMVQLAAQYVGQPNAKLISS
jgi:hypothetical protein